MRVLATILACLFLVSCLAEEQTTQATPETTLQAEAVTKAKFDDAFHPFGYFVLVDGTIGVVDFFDFKIVNKFKVGHRGVHRVAVLPDNRTLYLANTDNNKMTKVVMSKDGKKHTATELEQVPVQLHLWMASPDGSKVVQTSRVELKDTVLYEMSPLPDDSIALFDTKTDKFEKTLKLQSPASAEFSPDGKLLYVTNVHHGTLSVVDMATFKEIKNIPVGDNEKFLDDVAVSHNGKYLAVAAGSAKQVVVFDTNTWKIHKTVQLNSLPHDVGFSQDDSELWIVDRDRKPTPADEAANAAMATFVYVHDVATGDLKRKIEPPVASLRASLPPYAMNDVFLSTAVGGVLKVGRDDGKLRGQLVVGGVGKPVICGGVAF